MYSYALIFIFCIVSFSILSSAKYKRPIGKKIGLSIAVFAAATVTMVILDFIGRVVMGVLEFRLVIPVSLFFDVIFKTAIPFVGVFLIIGLYWGKEAVVRLPKWIYIVLAGCLFLASVIDVLILLQTIRRIEEMQVLLRNGDASVLDLLGAATAVTRLTRLINQLNYAPTLATAIVGFIKAKKGF